MESSEKSNANQPGLWWRGLQMLFIILAFNLAGSVLMLVAGIQFVLKVLSDATNEHLLTFSRGLGRYLQQCAHFLTFVNETPPFPFSAWPDSEKDVTQRDEEDRRG